MPIFALHQIDEITGQIKFYKLHVDGTCEFDDFEAEIEKEGNLAKELLKIQTRMLQVSNLQSLPETKFRRLKGCKDAYTEYEIKTDNLRVYLFKEEKTGNIIVSGGKKGTQKKDIPHFRNLKVAYIKSKNIKP